MDKINRLKLKINQFKQESKPENLKAGQKLYLKKFLKEEKKNLSYFIMLTIVEGLVLICLPLVLKFLVENDYNFFRLNNLIIDLVLISSLVGILMLVSYGLIFLDQTISYKLINNIKRDLLIHFYKNSSSTASELSNGTLIAKFVYHTQLLKMSLEKVVAEGIKAVVFYLIILIFAFLFSGSTFLLLIFGFPILCLVAVIFFLTGKYFISREQTLNTRLIKELYQQMGNLPQISASGLLQDRFETMNQLIEQDTYFRKRRETWVKYTDRLIFALIILLSAFLYLLKDYWSIFNFVSWSESAVSIILAGYFTKILLQVSHAGLFGQALKTGLLISVPEHLENPADLKKKVKIDFQQVISMAGRKVKLSKYGKTIARFNLEILPDSKILIYSDGPWGKSTLAKYCAGLVCVESLNIKNNKNYILANSWAKSNFSRQYISYNQIFNQSLAEFLFSKPSAEILADDIEKMFMELKKYPEFDFIFRFKNFLSKRIDSSRISESEIIGLQVAKAFLYQPELIAIDHMVLDSENQMVQAALKKLEGICNNSTIIYFSSNKNLLESKVYSAKYLLTQNEFKKI